MMQVRPQPYGYKHGPRRKGRCSICRKPAPIEAVSCTVCSEEYFMLADELVAEDMMREALKTPAFARLSQNCAPRPPSTAQSRWCSKRENSTEQNFQSDTVGLNPPTNKERKRKCLSLNR
jgi:hypothetical protein